MGRTRTNESNWWRGEGEEVEQEAMKVLESTAKTTLKRLDPRRTNFVEVGDLISEGWLRSMRYAASLSQWEPLQCLKHMMEEYRRLRHRSFSCSRNREPGMVRLSEDYPLECRRGQWGVRCLDLWDLIRVRCTPRQRRMVLARWEGCERREIADREGVSCETVRLEAVKTRRQIGSECDVETFGNGLDRP